MKTRTARAAALSLLILAGCASPASRISDRQRVYDQYPPEVQRQIAAGEVAVGFTPEQVRLALGEPTRKFTRTTAAGAAEVWAYAKSSPVFSFGLGGGSGFGSGFGGGAGISTSTGSHAPEDRLRVVFEDGKVTSVENTVK